MELPGAKDIERVKSLLQSTAQLEFWETFRGEEFLPFIINANELIKSKTKNQELTKQDSEVSEVEKLLGSEIFVTLADFIPELVRTPVTE